MTDAAIVDVEVTLLPVADGDLHQLTTRYAGSLDNEETRRFDRFKHRGAAALFMAGHGLMRQELGRVAGVAPSAIRYAITRHGKPHPTHPTAAAAWRVSLSHTETMAGVALCRLAEVGFDVQIVQGNRDLLGVAKRVFVDSELACLNAAGGHAESRWVRHFYTLWVAKEAWLKARGEGLSRSPKHVTLAVAGDDVRIMDFAPELADEPAAWTIETWWPSPTVVAAVAARTDKASLSLAVRTVT